MSTPACKDGANLDNDHTNGRYAKPKSGRADNSNGHFDPKELRVISACIFGYPFVICVSFFYLLYTGALDNPRKMAQGPGDIFVRLVDKRGIDPRASPPTSPAFNLALDFKGTPTRYRSCCGGSDSLLRVSYHDMILAWAQVPYFCVYGDRRSIDSVVTLEVEAKADALVLREEVRNLLWSEIQVVGKVQLDVDGKVADLGYLHCKFFIMKDQAADVHKSMCILRQ